MSTIEKMSIRGVRSFGTDAEDEQKITFSSPLTLILGANGCGKTTIIECLKYALTGEMPPGCNKGQSFVHDPKLFNSSECMGQVKLQIRNIRNDKLTVTRSMKTSIKKGAGLKFETLDSTIHIDIDGKTESISKRCVDTNVEMSHAMGVSKAIINNVLFCHQEDSNWPLDESKKLKEKFDEIFGTTGYNKAIDKILKLKKDYESQAKMKDGDLKLLLHIKKETEGKRVELQSTEEKVAKLQSKFDGFDEELKPIKERLIKIHTIELEISKLHTEKVELKTKLEKCKQHQTSLTSKVKTIFEGSMIMLDREIRLFKERMDERKVNLSELECDLNGVKNQENKIRSNLTDMERKRGTLVYQRQQEQDLSSERAKHLIDLARRLNIVVNVDLENSEQNVDETVASISAALKKEENDIMEMGRRHDKNEQEIQGKIDKIREDKASIESEITSKNKQAEELKRDQIKNQQEIDKVEKSEQDLKKVTAQITKIDQVLDEFKNSVNLEDTKKTISEKRNKRNQLQDQLEKIDEQINFLNSISQITAQISAKQSHLESRESEVKKVKNKHADNLRRLLNNDTIDSNYKRRIQTIYQNLQREINDLNKTISRNQQTIIELDMMRKTQKDELSRYERELREGEEQIYEHCHSTPFSEVLERVKENIAKYQFDHGTLKSAEVLYKKYMQKMENEPCCPLCHKDMTGNEINDLTTELLDEIRRLPENIERAERVLKTENRKYESLLALQPVTDKLETLKVEIPKCKQNLCTTEEKLSSARNDQESYQMSLAEPNINIELANSMLGDMSLLDEALKDVTRIKQELVDLNRKLPDRVVPMTMDEAQVERSVLAAELKNETSEIDSLQSKYDKELDTMNSLREKRNTLKDTQIKLQEGVQALTQMKARQQEIRDQVEKTEVSLREIKRKLEPIAQELREAINMKENLRNENRRKINVAREKLIQSQRIDTEVKRCSEELQKLAQLNLANAIEQLQVNMEKCYMDRQEKVAEQESISKRIEQLRKEISGQETVERDLHDNRELKVLKNEEKELQARFDDLTKDMGDLDFRSINREKESLIDKEDRITRQRSQLIGQMGELQSQVAKIKGELNQPKYQDAIKNYRQAFYEHHILKKIVCDLGLYRVALEWALLKYHSEKMEKINRLIRELWRSIYRGNDIDFIQIKTDENKISGDKRRSYDYRVVQSKHDIELDMRGRCSAGQRVLACLVIRIALAETFSSSCGVLALDEPTTNLDRANIISLCEALNKIVEERQSQSNFMLLVITHDEDFITTLGRIMNYYKVSRSDSGKSIITKLKVY